MSAVQGLGIELYFYVRCPTCNKVLGNLHDDYNRLVNIAINDINESIPFGLSIEQRTDAYDRLFENRFNEIMQQLGIKRHCCMMRMKNPQQIAVGGENAPVENIAIGRHALIEGKVKRTPTRIELTKPSRVPGGSNLNMMSITGFEDNQQMIYSKRNIFTSELTTSTPWTGELPGLPTVQTMELLSNPPPAPINQLMNMPVQVIESGESTPIKKRPKLKNVQVIGNKPDFMDIEYTGPSVYSDIPGIETEPQVVNNNFYDVGDMTTSFNKQFYV